MEHKKRGRKKIEKIPPTVLGQQFVITLKLGNEVYEGKGNTCLEALESLKRPQKILLKGILTVTRGEAKHETVLQPVRAKRLFYKVAQYHIAKQLSFGL